MVKIISDSTCDLSPELIAKYDIDILPDGQIGSFYKRIDE